MASIVATTLLFLLITAFAELCNCSNHDYLDALSKSILFFEGQRSGFLPRDQRVTWRGHSGLSDGYDYYQDNLIGGYYDAGDNVKFGFPMAFTTTLLAWSVIEFGDIMPPNELRNSLVAIRWGTDYLLKAVSRPNRIYVQVGEPYADHSCWERPEDMDTPRTVYAVDAPNPASDVAGETAAALAAASMAFRGSDLGYSETLLRNAVRMFEFADTYRGAYSDNAHIKFGVCPFYCDFNGYHDEILWGAAWLGVATCDDKYFAYVQNNAKSFGSDENIYEFGWDDKHAGINILLAKEVVEKSMYSLQSYKSSADKFMCSLVPGASSYQIAYTPGGLIYKPGSSNLQHVTSISFLLLAYANALQKSSQVINCGSVYVTPSILRRLAKQQVDYVLGDNPMHLSYMVGYGERYPLRIHHRGSSIPSIKAHPDKIGCADGTMYFNSTGPNVNVHVGAIVGGPILNDDAYRDDRAEFKESEPTTYINAPFVGVLAYFAASH